MLIRYAYIYTYTYTYLALSLSLSRIYINIIFIEFFVFVQKVEKRRHRPDFSMTCLRCLRQKEREKKEGQDPGDSLPVEDVQAGTEPSSEVEEPPKQQSFEKKEEITFQPGKIGLAFERNAVKKVPSAESQAGKAGVSDGWILHSVGGEAVGADKKAILAKIGAATCKGTKAVGVE